MGKRYSQRPSRLLPRGTLRSEYERLAFDMNVMLLGMAAEIKAQDEATSKSRNNKQGFTATRHEAISMARRARKLAYGTDG